MLALYAQLVAIFATVLVVGVLLLLLAPALEHWRWLRDRRGRGGRYVR